MTQGNHEDAIDEILQRVGKDLVAQQSKSSDQVIFDVGTSFHEAAMRCAHPIQNPDGTQSTPTSPMICCFAFASELYLKSLLHGSNARGHNLSTLFGRLSSDDRQGVADRYEALTERKLPQLRRDIDCMADAFVNWRYIYEKSSAKIPVHRLATISRSFYQHLRNVRPQWTVNPHTNERINLPVQGDVASTIYMGGGIMVRARLRENSQVSEK